MSEITSLVTAEAVKEVLRSEEVRSALKQKLRHNLEARLDAEVDAILDELLGAPAAPEPEGIAGEGSASDSGDPTLFWMNCWAHRQLRSRKASRVRGVLQIAVTPHRTAT